MPNEEITFVKLNFLNSLSQFFDASYVFDDYKRICQENESNKNPLPSCICFSFSFVSWSCRRCLLTCFAFRALLEQRDTRSDSAKQTEFVWTSEALKVWSCNWELWKEASKELNVLCAYIFHYMSAIKYNFQLCWKIEKLPSQALLHPNILDRFHTLLKHEQISHAQFWQNSPFYFFLAAMKGSLLCDHLCFRVLPVGDSVHHPWSTLCQSGRSGR